MNYEKVDPYPCTIIGAESGDYQVKQMKYGKIAGKAGNAGKDKTRIIYNESITIEGIPLKAQEYIVNKKSALDWLVERCCKSKDKKTGIENDFNEYAGGKYIFDLVLSIITVSMKTLDLIDQLPQLDIYKDDQ